MYQFSIGEMISLSAAPLMKVNWNDALLIQWEMKQYRRHKIERHKYSV